MTEEEKASIFTLFTDGHEALVQGNVSEYARMIHEAIQMCIARSVNTLYMFNLWVDTLDYDTIETYLVAAIDYDQEIERCLAHLR